MSCVHDDYKLTHTHNGNGKSHVKIHCNKNTHNTMSSSALCETTASDFCVFVLHSAVTDTFVEMTDVLPVCMCAIMMKSNETTVYRFKIDCIAFYHNY